jgi:hypothetical protein
MVGITLIMLVKEIWVLFSMHMVLGMTTSTFVVTIVRNVEELIAMMFLLDMLFTGMVLDLTVEEIEPSVTLV